MNLIDQTKDVAREICRNYGVMLSVDALHAFAGILQPMKVLKGHNLVEEGAVCSHMFYVRRGLVLQYYTKHHMTMTEHISHEGDMVICIESFFQREPSKIVVTTLEPSTVYAIPHDALESIACRSYEICKLVFSIYQRSLIISQRKADILRFETAKVRYVRTLNDNPEIIRRAPLHYVASLLQMTPETLSRVRTQVMEDKRKAQANGLLPE